MKGAGAAVAVGAFGPMAFGSTARAAPTTAQSPANFGLYTLHPGSNPTSLVVIEPTTGAASVAATLSGASMVGSGAMAFSPTGELYAADGRGRQLVRIDPTTGVVSSVGTIATGLNFAGIAFDADGTLYGVNNRDDTLYTIDTTDASATAVGTGIGVPEINHIGLAVKFDATSPNELYLVAGNNSNNRKDDVIVLNKTTGAASSVLADQFETGTGVGGEFSRYDTDQLFALRNGKTLLSYNLNDGNATRVDNVTVDGVPLRSISLATPWIGNVGIDVRPNNRPSPVNGRMGGVVRVAILSSPTFDATTQVDVSSLRFGEAESVSIDADGTITGGTAVRGSRVWYRDVDGDGTRDLIVQFGVSGGFDEPDDLAKVVGLTTGGVPFQGTDVVMPVPVPTGGSGTVSGSGSTGGGSSGGSTSFDGPTVDIPVEGGQFGQ